MTRYPLPLALASLGILAMLVLAIVAYTVPSARGDLLRDPRGSDSASSWNVVE